MKRKYVDEKIAYRGNDGETHEVVGQKTNLALGVIPLGESWASVMLLNGWMLEGGFPDVATTHRFNELIVEARLSVGETTSQKFIERAGGFDPAAIIVRRCRRRVMEKS